MQERRRNGRALARQVTVVLALVGLMAASVACGSGSTEAGSSAPTTTAAPQTGGRLVVALPTREPEAVLRLTLEPLTTFADDGNVVPYLAESITPNAALDRWTIRVRDGITFHNGEPLDAAAVKANLDTYSVSPIYRTDPLSPIVGTTVIDPRTVEVELSRPWPSFPAHLTAEQSDGTGLIAAPATLEKMGPLFLAQPNVEGLYGTGPFILQRAEAKPDKWLGRRNPTYWQKGLPYLDEVEVRAVPDNASRISGLNDGSVDVALTSQPPADPASLEVVTQKGESQVLVVAFNMTRAPFDDPRLREAAQAATDVEALAAIAGVDPSRLVAGPYGPGSPWTDRSVTRTAHDADRARALVEEYEREKGPARVRLTATDLETGNIAVQQELARQWKDAGLDVDVSVVDPFAQTATLLVAGDFDAVIGNQFGMPDPDLHYFWWHSSAKKTEGKGAAYNFVGLDDPDLDEALDDARATTDESARREALATVQQRLAAARAYVWLWETRWSTVAIPRVHGLEGAPLPGGKTRMPIVGPRLNLEAVWLQQ